MKRVQFVFQVLLPVSLMAGVMAAYMMLHSESQASIDPASAPAAVRLGATPRPALMPEAPRDRLALLLDNGLSRKDFRCLAQAVYFEARSEPYEGQVAVAHVIMNRVHSARYPDSICGVVFQNEHLRHLCQFSFACDGLSDNPYEMAAWAQARNIAEKVLLNSYRDITDRSTHYHADYVTPYWADHMQPTLQVGTHIFYREDS